MITKNKKALCIMSGGMDSTLSAYMMKKIGYDIIAVHFNYAQRTQDKELSCFHAICDELGVLNRYVIDLDFFAQIGASALTDENIAVPTGGLEEGVPVTYVPFRNGIFLSIAAAIAEKEGAEAISIGVVEEDSSGYPDCRESYIKSMEQSINLGTKDETKIEIFMPLVHLKKSQIVQKAVELNTPLHLTWSCYKDEDKACGVCDSCRLRLNGFKLAGVKDPIEYQ
ncbi:MAG: 7-cyano-7-deazaguanine synthase QueC [Sulfurimonas sp.]|uniref:7-cyano-7-deazaguanine synthase QueC n=1 Tax=Sulfurimonas sp. TaxID=2022749 RepID=UPI00263399D9|nr:7-cyano-7-deazaguanine synthase QueC [Sulfurimonas sp.]MDD5400164.1 7-cyano-7-deazaguanine synthase QueC [Sulfurimonas sp.]